MTLQPRDRLVYSAPLRPQLLRMLQDLASAIEVHGIALRASVEELIEAVDLLETTENEGFTPVLTLTQEDLE